jgi:peptidoglycan/LPS O-acetylase OafA/YrhL
MRNPSSSYLPELDVVRFWAFFAVFFFHTVYLLPPGAGSALPHQLVWALVFTGEQAGRFGVDLFFTLSAFLITSLLVAEKAEHGRIQLSKFYLRRILRIWPLYFGMTFLVFGLAYLQHEREMLEFCWPYVLMVPNWAWALKGNPAVHTTAFLAIIVFWSLGIEEQFYLLWPLVLRRMRIDQLRRAGWFLIGVSAIVRFVCWTSDVPHPGIYANTFARLDPIAVGILLAAEWAAMKDGSCEASLRHRILGSWPILPVGIVGFLLAGFIAGSQGLNNAMFIFMGYPLVAWSGYLILFHTLLNLRPDGRKGRVFRGLAYLGKISYGLYIFHAFVYDLSGPVMVKLLGLKGTMREMPAGLMLVLVGFSFLATVLVAHLSYRYFESYFLAMKRRFSTFSAPEKNGPAILAPEALQRTD